MASAFGKFLTQITVPTGGWDFTFKEGATNRTVTIPAGTYGSVLEVVAALEDALNASYTATCSVSSVGIVSIYITTMTSMNWALTDSGFSQLGFSGSETVDTYAITSTNPHDWDWYPGTISWGTDRGAGLEDDSDWLPEQVGEGVVAGSGAQSMVGPARPPYERQLVFGPVLRSEAFHKTRGPVCFRDRWRYLPIRWYPDRSVGTVAAPGDQGDPGAPYYDGDDDCDFWLVTVVGEPRIDRHAARPDLFTVTIRFNAEPRTS